MPNWCDTSYTIEGDEKQIESLYKKMTKLEDKRKYGLKDLVRALGGDPEKDKIRCRGNWLLAEPYNPDRKEILLDTNTAWEPMTDVFYFIKKKYPKLRIFYKSDEMGCRLYWTNDVAGKHYSERYIIYYYTPDEEIYDQDYFTCKKDAVAAGRNWRKEEKGNRYEIIKYELIEDDLWLTKETEEDDGNTGQSTTP